jgi:hypothetical protein
MFTSELEWNPHSKDFMRNEMALSLTGPAADRTLLTFHSSISPKWECETDTILSSIPKNISIVVYPCVPFILTLKRAMFPHRLLLDVGEIL